MPQPAQQPRPAEQQDRRGRNEAARSPLDYLSLGAGAAAFLYVYGGAALFVEYFKTHLPAGDIIDLIPPRRFVVIGFPVVFGAVVTISLVAVMVSRLAPGVAAWYRRTNIFVGFGLFLTASLAAVIVGALIAPLQLRYVEVTTKTGCVVTGSFISADAQGVHVADGKAASAGTTGVPLVLTVPESAVRSFELRDVVAVSSLPITRSSKCDAGM